MKQNKMTVCKHCGKSIARGAKSCPHCGAKNKKPVYQRPWFILLIIIILIAVIMGLAGGSSDQNGSTDTAKPETAKVTYTAYSVSQLVNDLNSNAMKASEKYKDQYVELTGKLQTIDSSGSYITLAPTDDEFALYTVQCFIQSDEQKSVITELSAGDTIIVKGKITDVGEVLGYTLDIDAVSKAQ